MDFDAEYDGAKTIMIFYDIKRLMCGRGRLYGKTSIALEDALEISGKR